MEMQSPGGFVFGIQGWEYGEVRPKTITFFINGTTKVSDHRGNNIRELSGSHSDVIDKLEAEGYNWQTLDCAGWPQLPYAKLVEVSNLPPTPVDELMLIKDKSLRTDAVKMRREMIAAAADAEEIEV